MLAAAAVPGGAAAAAGAGARRVRAGLGGAGAGSRSLRLGLELLLALGVRGGLEVGVEVRDVADLVPAPEGDDGPVHDPDDELEVRDRRAVPEEDHHEEEEAVLGVAAARDVPDLLVGP